MSAYYNEFEPFAAAWLRELIAAGLIAPGDVDERSIIDVTGADVKGYTQCHFFAGIGGWSLALRMAGWPDDREVWTGSCPCQPFSTAGKRKGVDDERHVWPEFARLIGECSPAICFGEQVGGRDGLQWLGAVRSDLEEIGYAVGAADYPAAGVDSDQVRQRLYWVADPVCVGGANRLQRAEAWAKGHPDVPHDRRHRGVETTWPRAEWKTYRDGTRRRAVAGVRELADGVPNRMDYLRCFGNAIVPQVAALWIGCVMELNSERGDE